MESYLQLTIAAIPILGVLGQVIAWQLRVPSVLILLLIGLIVGPFTGLINPDLLLGHKLFPIISLSVAIILFDGGLSLNLGEFFSVKKLIRNLITFGTLFSWIIISVSAYFILGLSMQLSLLLGAILLVTGPTVITPLLDHIKLKRQLSSILKWEGILLDPIGAMLAVLVFKIIFIGNKEIFFSTAAFVIIKTVLFGTIIGAVSAGAIAWILHKKWFPDFLHESFTLICVLGVYASANLIQSESGLFAATIMGVVLANQQLIKIRHIVTFKGNITILLLSSIFIILGARLHLDILAQYLNLSTLLFLLVLVLLARPISVFLSTFRQGLNRKEKVMMSWLYPRGIVSAAIASHFALQLQEAGISGAEKLFPITFIVIIFTVTLYSLTSKSVAISLNLVKQIHKGVLIIGIQPWICALSKCIVSEGVNVLLIDASREEVTEAKELGLDAICGNIASKKIRDVVSSGKFESMLALTSSDEINLLSAMIFETILDPKRVYRLYPTDKNFLHLDPHGQILFGNKTSHNYISARITAGATFKTFHIDENTELENVFKEHPKAIPILVITKQRHIKVFCEEEKVKPVSGQAIICLV